MTCPYPDCKGRALPAAATHCPECRRFVKRCAARNCGEWNRALAVFCRGCGERLAEPSGQWTGLQGGASRAGLNPYALSGPWESLQPGEKRALRLGSRCLSLMFYEDFLFAISEEGIVQALDLGSSRSAIAWNAVDRVAAYPAIAEGILYIAGAEGVHAFRLAGLAGRSRRPVQLWEKRVEGKPMHGLLPHGGRLFLTTERGGEERRVLAMHGVAGGSPTGPELVHRGSRFGGLTAGPTGLFFLSEGNGGRLAVHRLAGNNGRVTHESHGLPGDLAGLRDLVSPAAVGHKVYAVLGERDELCLLDAQELTFDRRIYHDAVSFAVAGLRDGVVAGSNSLYFVGYGRSEDVQHPISTAPVVLRGRMAAVGFADGRVQLHNLQNPPAFHELRVGRTRVTSLASAGRWIAAGDEEGTVVVARLGAA